MLALGTLLALPVAAPLGGLAWLARRIGEAAMAEHSDPARVQTALLALEEELVSGRITEAEYESREAALLAWLDSIRPDDGQSQALALAAAAEGADDEQPVNEPSVPGGPS